MTMRHQQQQAQPPSSSSMITLSLSIIIILSLLISSAATTTDTPPPPYIHTDYFLLNCGSSSNATSQDGRNWDGDTTSKFSPSNLQHASSSSKAAEQNPSVTDVPFKTARIIRSPITYSFPVLSGPKFVRLYFYPATYSTTFNKSTTSFFSVTANTYTLLTNFSAFLTVAASPDPTIVKEFVLNVLENQRLNITFSPDSPSSYAFVNGIEVVSMPDPLYQSRGGGDDDDLPKFVAANGYVTRFQLANNTALENIYRLNVGGNDVSVNGDTGMYRMWRQDDEYVHGKSVGQTPFRGLSINYTDKTPPYVAPEIVYMTTRTMGNQGLNLNFNLTWILPVDSGFNYLVRLHFCEIQQEVTLENQRLFFIYINNQTAEKDADVIHWSGGRGFPVFRDYVVNVPDRDGRRRSKQDLWLAMYPNMELKPEFADAILNGLEIFKLNQSDGSLAGSNPDPTVNPSSPEKPVFPGKSERKGSFPAVAVGGVIGGFVVVLIFVSALVYRRRRSVKNAASGGGSEAKTSWVPFSYMSKSTRSSKTSTSSSSLPSDLCRRFLISEIRSATSNFHDNFVIGSGGFGNVYKGYVDNGSTIVAIKRLNPSSKQGVHEFETEIKMLSKLRHLHLVSLIGYSDDDGEMVLVYDYMANGTLRDHLYKTKNPPLSWKKRLQICIGAARGLHYLHTSAKHTIIHRDVKSTNILLDEKWVAKVSDFGLSKMGPTDVSHTHVSTMVKGSFGYVDPEYFRRQQLTEKSDVYSFGVVLLEVLCARPAVIQGISREQVNLAEWGRNCYRKGIIDQIVDKNLRGQIAPECLKKFGEIATSCILDQGIERPTMGDVVWNLEFALQLQETAERVKGDGGTIGLGLDQMRMAASPSSTRNGGDSTTTDDDDIFSASGGQVSNPKSSDSLLNKSGRKSGTTTSSLEQLVGNESVFSEINNTEGR